VPPDGPKERPKHCLVHRAGLAWARWTPGRPKNLGFGLDQQVAGCMYIDKCLDDPIRGPDLMFTFVLIHLVIV